MGSNLSNILLVLGTTASIKGFSVSKEAIYLDFPLMVIFAILMLVFMRSGRVITRLEGWVLLLLYGFVIYRCIYPPTII